MLLCQNICQHRGSQGSELKLASIPTEIIFRYKNKEVSTEKCQVQVCLQWVLIKVYSALREDLSVGNKLNPGSWQHEIQKYMSSKD